MKGFWTNLLDLLIEVGLIVVMLVVPFLILTGSAEARVRDTPETVWTQGDGAYYGVRGRTEDTRR